MESEQILVHSYRKSRKYGLDPSMTLNIMEKETGFNPRAVSPKKAKGLMQVMDETAKRIAHELGVKRYDIFDIETNIEFGCYYIMDLLRAGNSVCTMLSIYNTGVDSSKAGDDYINSIIGDEDKWKMFPTDTSKNTFKAFMEGFWKFF